MSSGYTSMSSMERETCKITVGGVTYTMAEYKKLKKNGEKNSKSKKTKKKKKSVKEISAVAMEIDKMLKPITILKSLSAYYDHAYRQWGTIANEILENRKIAPHFIKYRVNVSELDSIVADVKKMTKRNEKAAYQYVEKITWKLEDIKEHITNLMKGAVDSGLMELYRNEECINGKGKRLGLQTLASKTFKAIGQLEDAIGALKKIADEGTDPFAVGDHMSARTRARCWA